MEKLKDFIEKKKEKSASRRPRYGTRKLSVGLVSCVLGYCIFFSPTVVSAQVGEGSESTSTRVEASADTSDSDSESESDETKAVETPSAATNEVESPQAKASVSEVADEAPAVAETPVAEAEKEAPAEEVVEAEKEEPAVSEEKLEPVAEEDAETKEVSKKEEIEAPKANKEANIEETVAADEKENKTEENKDTLKSEDDKEAVDEEQQADVEEFAKKEPAEVDEESKEEATEAETLLAEEEKEALGISEKIKPEALQAGETEEDAITNVEITIGGAKNGEKTEIVNPTALPKRTNEGNTDINLEARVDFDIPEGTKHGKTFDFVVSDNVNLHGVLKSEEEGQPVVFDGEEIATAERLTDGRNGYKYTFNEKVDNLKDIRVRIIYPLFIDPDKVPMGTKEYEIGEDGKYKLDNEGNPILKADNKEKVSVTVAGKTASKDYTVEYESEVFDVKTTGPTLSGIADIDQVDDNNYNHTIYVNPTADQLLNGSHVTVQNEKGYNTITFDEDVKNSVKVYKVKDPNKLPLSFGNDFNDGNYEDVTDKAEVKLEKDKNNADLNKLVVDVKQGNTNKSMPFDNKDFDSSVYVVKYTGKRTPNKAFKTNTIFTADWRKANGNAKNLSKLGDQSWAWTNEIVIDDADAIALANKTYSLGDKVWIDADENGSQGDSETGLEGVKVILKGINMSDRETTTDANGNYKFEGLRNGEYTVEFEIPTGYAPTTANAEGTTDINNSDASQAKGSKVATAIGEINCADNINVDFGVVKSNEGSFTEHHVYEVYKDGVKQEDQTTTIDIDKTTGTEKETFKTSAKPNGTEDNKKEGFTLVEGEITKSPEITEDVTGAEVTPNYINEKDLEVTYVYRKDITTSGSFTEHHVYEVYKDGVKQEDQTTTIDIDKTTGTEKETFKTSAKPNGTEDNKKEGFTLVEGEITKSPEITEDITGAEVTPNYINEKDLEVTYVYRKDITTSGSFTEHHVYEVYKDGVKQEDQTTTIDIDKTTGTEKETFKTSAKPNGTEDNKKEGFTLVEGEITKSPEITEDVTGAEVTPNYINEKDLEVTYVYRKDITTSGSFTEHHVYEVYKDGVKQEDQTTTIDIDKTTGTEKETFKTSAKPNGTEDNKKEGFTLVEGEITKSPEITEDVTGAEVTPNYINEKDLEVTYVYRKDITTSGSFTEHHVYEVYKDGVKQEDQTTKIDIEKTTGTEKETFTTSAKPNGTEKDPKTGFELVKDSIKKSPEITEDVTGAEVTPNYINEKDLEVTYVYRKDITTSGSFTEHHVYEVYKDGVKQEDQTTTIDIDKTTGTEKETFKTSAKPNGTEDNKKEGFTLVEGEITKSPEITEDVTGAEVTPNYINEKDLEVTYCVYRKDITTSGSFTEHHVYEVYKDGVKQEDQTTKIDIEKTTGTEKETFTTSAKPNGTEKDPKTGFELVKDSIKKSPEITEDVTGAEVTPNYINEKDLEVTYVYRKDVKSWTPIEETGKFQEHHIYRTIDKNGEVTEEKVDGKVTGGTKDMTYTTGKVDKEGFRFVGTENPVENPTFSTEGESTTGKFKPGKKQEITYVYEKTVKDTPVSPSEPSEPEEPKDTTPLVPLTPAEEVEVERITHHDHKTPGTPVVTEVPSTPVVETEKSVEEKTEKSEETKEVENKEEKAEEVKEAEEAKTVEDDNLEKPQAPESHDKLAPRAPEKDKAPKTGDAGILSSLGLGSLAASGLAFIELKKRNKKNK